MQNQFYHATGQGSAAARACPSLVTLSPMGEVLTDAIAAAQPPPNIQPGDRVRVFDGLYCAFFWHVVTETITGAHPQIKVAAYDCYISASLVNGHRKGGKQR